MPYFHDHQEKGCYQLKRFAGHLLRKETGRTDTGSLEPHGKQTKNMKKRQKCVKQNLFANASRQAVPRNGRLMR